MKHLQDASVLVLGLGDSGLAMARWAARCGARVRVWDTRESPPNAAALNALVPAATLIGGALDDAAIADATWLLKSPGLAPHDVRIAGPIAAAVGRGVGVANELDLFIRALADLHDTRDYAPKVLAITGTNGKTTTTAMTAQLVARCGKRVAMAGNIGPTLLQTLADALDTLDATSAADATDAAHRADAANTTDAANASPAIDNAGLPEVWVLELSSFQLDGVVGFEPSAATVLNISQDHLDWHGSMAAYLAAKGRVFGERTVRVVNVDDPLVLQILEAASMQRSLALEPTGRRSSATLLGRVAGEASASQAPRATKTRRASAYVPSVVQFGLSAPVRPGDFGLVVDHGMAWLARAQPLEDGSRGNGRRGRGAVVNPGATDTSTEPDAPSVQPLMPADALRIRGRHNAANALAALALATAIGCPLAPMLHALRDYRGEPHRVEFVGQVDEVDAFDDSKGTNVGATVAALDGLGADRSGAKLVVILGGDGKGQDFTPLQAPLRRHARAVATIGRDAGAIEAAIAGATSLAGVVVQRHASLEAATRWCFAQARAGDAVLLSPACASLDMFRNYAHRADVFVAEVQAIAAEHGVVLA